MIRHPFRKVASSSGRTIEEVLLLLITFLYMKTPSAEITSNVQKIVTRLSVVCFTNIEIKLHCSSRRPPVG